MTDLAPTPSWASFFAPPPTAPGAHVRALLARLLGADGGEPASGGAVTCGRHTDPRTGEAVEGGLIDPAIFGDDGARPGHIALPEPLVHPAMRAELARLTGLTEGEVRAVARFDSCLEDGRPVSRERLARSEIDFGVILANGGAKALRALLTARGLPDAALVDHVAVPPPPSRPLAPTDAGVRMPGPIGRALEDFLGALADSAYARESMFCSLQMEAWERVQDAFDRLCATVAGTATVALVALDEAWLEEASRGWSEATAGVVGTPERVLERTRACLAPTPPGAPRIGGDAGVDPLCPVSCRFVDDGGEGALLVQLPYAFVLFDLPSARLRWAVRGAWTSVLQIVACSAYAFIVQRGDVLPSVHLLALDSGRWTTGWEGVTPPRFPMGRYKSNHWSVYDYQARTARPMQAPGNWREGALLSPCLRYVWIEERSDIVRLDDERAQLEVAALPRPTSADLDDEAFEDEEVLDRRLTFVALPSGFRVFHRGILSDRGVETARLPASYDCACFNADGTRLALGRPGELELHRLGDDGRVIGRATISLARLEDLLSLRLVRELVPAMTAEMESSLLNAFGTADAIRAASRDDLQNALAGDCCDEVPARVIDELCAVLGA